MKRMEINKCMGCMSEFRGYPCPGCGYDPKSTQNVTFILPPETIVGGKYLVGKMLGQGGFGITYIGWDIALERKVAIKEYYPSGQVSRMPGTRSLVWSESEQARNARLDGMQMFLKEARKMAKLEEIPGVVKIRDLFQENDTAYIVMDFVEGKTLKDTLRRSGPMSWDRAKLLFLSAIRAMERVHEAGLIHRDLSPDNLMLTPSGDVKILDLGAAKDLSINSGASSMQVAKGGFSPFEQYTQRGGSGPWTDVYAMAATIYYTLTGKVPPTAIDRVTEDTIRWDYPGLLALPASALNALKKAMAVLPKQRTQSMTELEQGLFSNGQETKIITEGNSGGGKTKKPKWLIPAAAAVVLVAAGAAAMAWNSGSSVNTPADKASIFPTTPGSSASNTAWLDTVDAIIDGGTQDIYTYSNGAKLKQYFDGDNEVARIFVNEDGTAEFTFKARYDNNGELLEERGYDSEGIQKTRTVYTRDADGNILEKLSYNESGDLKSRNVYNRNSDGKTLDSATYDGNGNLESVGSFTYDNEGREIRWERKDVDGNFLSWSTTTYDSDGNSTETFEYDDGTTRIQNYDSDGNLLESISYDARGKQKYREVHSYDSNDHEITYCYYGADDSLSFKYIYSYSGDRKISNTYYSYYDGSEHATDNEYLYASHDVEVGTITPDQTNISENFKSIRGTFLRSFSCYNKENYKSSNVSYYGWNGSYQLYLGYDENGELISKSIYHYDVDGNQAGRTFYFYSSYSDKTSVTEYDADGNKISETEYPGKTKLVVS